MLSNNQEEIAQYKAALTRLQEQIAFIQEHFRPLVGGELYLNGEKVCELLHITKRLFPYIQIGGKILFKQSDILKILEANYKK